MSTPGSEASASAPGFDARRFKAMERAGFNRIAARYADGAPLRATLADALLDAAALQPGLRVLDLASGPALLAGAAASRVAPGGSVLATDIADAMLAEGAHRHAAERTLLFAAADAECLCLADASVDRVLAGLALFMFPQPQRALAEIHRVLAPGGLAVLSVWGERAAVPLLHCAQDAIAAVLPAPRVERPSVFRFGTPAVLEAALGDAGFEAVRILPCDFSCRFDDADAYWQAFLDLAGGVAEALSRLPEPRLQALRAAVATELEAHRADDGAPGYILPARALVAVARKPD